MSNIKQADKREFVQAMKKVFDVSFELTTENSYNSTNFQNIPDEVSKGENILKTGNFKKAEVLFNKAITMDPYCWQAYWGLFKASINAKTNEEIYFPGFIKLLRASDLLDTYPDYIDYYKSAKCYAAAQKSPEINFNAIEMEYKNADVINQNGYLIYH